MIVVVASVLVAGLVTLHLFYFIFLDCWIVSCPLLNVTEFDKDGVYQKTTVWPLGRGSCHVLHTCHKFRFLF